MRFLYLPVFLVACGIAAETRPGALFARTPAYQLSGQGQTAWLVDTAWVSVVMPSYESEGEDVHAVRVGHNISRGRFVANLGVLVQPASVSDRTRGGVSVGCWRRLLEERFHRTAFSIGGGWGWLGRHWLHGDLLLAKRFFLINFQTVLSASVSPQRPAESAGLWLRTDWEVILGRVRPVFTGGRDMLGGGLLVGGGLAVEW